LCLCVKAFQTCDKTLETNQLEAHRDFRIFKLALGRENFAAHRQATRFYVLDTRQLGHVIAVTPDSNWLMVEQYATLEYVELESPAA